MLYGLEREDAAAEWIQEIVESTEITTRAPEDVRAAVDAAVELHVYGMFAWVFFTAATLQARLTHELALGARFLEYYAHRVPVERRNRGSAGVQSDFVEGSEMPTIRWRLGYRGSHRRVDGWRVVGHPDFDGSLAALYRWGRDEGVLRHWLNMRWSRHVDSLREQIWYFGLSAEPPLPPRPRNFADWTEEQREHWLQHDYRDGWERLTLKRAVENRNDAAHPTMQAVYMPQWSADEIEALALFVNSLWL